MNNVVEDIKYELYKDHAIVNNEEISNESYIDFINKKREKYKKINGEMGENEKEFEDYLKCDVLTEIANYIVKREKNIIDISLDMDEFFRKYNVIDRKDANTIIDLPMYNRIQLRYEKFFERKELDNINKDISEISEELRNKYYDLINPETNNEGYEKYEELKVKKLIIDNIEKLENVKEPVKILVKFSEASIEYPQVYTLSQMNNLCKKAEEEITIEKMKKLRHPDTYYKTDFFIIIDDGGKSYIDLHDRIDIGDREQNDFYSFIAKYYGYERIRKLEQINKQVTNAIGYIEECVIDKFNEMNIEFNWDWKLDENILTKVMDKIKEDDELAVVLDESIGSAIVEVKDKLSACEEEEASERE